MRWLVEFYFIVATLGAQAAVSAWGIANLRRCGKTLRYRASAATITGFQTRKERWTD
jgi:hypothetical protein